MHMQCSCWPWNTNFGQDWVRRYQVTSNRELLLGKETFVSIFKFTYTLLNINNSFTFFAKYHTTEIISEKFFFCKLPMFYNFENFPEHDLQIYGKINGAIMQVCSIDNYVIDATHAMPII